MEVVEESIKLNIKIEKVKQQFLQLLNTFDDPQPTSLSDAQSYLKHLYEWKKKRSSQNDCKHSVSNDNCHNLKTNPHLGHVSTPINDIQKCYKENVHQFYEHDICNKTFVNLKQIDEYKPKSCIKSQQNLLKRSNSHLNNLLPDAPMSWDAFHDMSFLPRDSVVHDCDSFMHENNAFESTFDFPMNSTIKSSRNLNKGKLTLKDTKKVINTKRDDECGNILDRGYHPYKPAFSQHSSSVLKDKLKGEKRNSSHFQFQSLISHMRKSKRVNSNVMSALNTCQLESFYNIIEGQHATEGERTHLKRQKAVSCLQPGSRTLEGDKNYSLPISSLLCQENDENNVKNESSHSKKLLNGLWCLPLLSS